MCRSVDFVSKDEQKARLWIEALKKVMTQNSRNPMTFDEKLWIINNFRSADLDRNGSFRTADVNWIVFSGEISFNELWKLLRKLNLQLKEKYVRALFKVIKKKLCYMWKTSTEKMNAEQWVLSPILIIGKSWTLLSLLASRRSHRKSQSKGKLLARRNLRICSRFSPTCRNTGTRSVSPAPTEKSFWMLKT